MKRRRAARRTPEIEIWTSGASMKLTRAQRRKINIANAQASTGPKSELGRQIARKNALTHGLTATVLTLPNEDENVVQFQINQWVDYYAPQAPGEMVLVEEAARSAIRLRRCARHETALLTEQVNTVVERREQDNKNRVTEICGDLASEPEDAARALQSFAAGVNYLLERWHALDEELDTDGYWPENESLIEAVRYLGANPDEPATAGLDGFTLCLGAAVLHPECDPKYLRDLLGKDLNAEYRALHGARPFDKATALASVKEIIAGQIEHLEALQSRSQKHEAAALAVAREQAVIPEDSPAARHWMRYHREATSAFHRAYRELEKLRVARCEAELLEAEIEADDLAETPVEEAVESGSRNEPNPAAEPPLSDFPATTSVTPEMGIFGPRPLPGERGMRIRISSAGATFEEVAATEPVAVSLPAPAPAG
jgi:hypothetical protein